MLLLSLLLTGLGGCASIIDGQTQTVTFNSSPSGARVYVNGMDMGSTPLTATVKRSKVTMVSAQKPGYEAQQLMLQTKVNMWFWGNIISGGLYGSTTDYSTDAMVEYSPNMYHITLNPLPFTENEPGRSIRTRIEPEDMSSERQVRNYVLRNHAYILTDLANGRGEYLSSLYKLLKLPNSSETTRQFKILASRHRATPAFAEAVLTQFYPQPSKAPRELEIVDRAEQSPVDVGNRYGRGLIIEER